jgi:D-aminoacyl-tRNA deacylase
MGTSTFILDTSVGRRLILPTTGIGSPRPPVAGTDALNPDSERRSSVIAIVVSRADEASEHIGEHVLELADWEERADESRPDAEGGGTYYRTDGFALRTFDDLHIYLDDPAPAFDDPEYLVFASRHSGDTGALLSAHFTGNFGEAKYGGDPGSLARACPNAQKAVVEALDEHAPERYDVAVECTHHGPTDVSVPSMFVELGSDEAQWRDPEGARAVARAILELDGVAADRERQLVGFGGGHYAPRVTRVVRETDWAVGHVGSDWQLAAMGDPADHPELLDRAFAASAAEYAVVEGDHPDVEAAVESLGHRVVSETWVRETEGVHLDVVDAVERDLGTVDEGVRFGDCARSPDGADFESVHLPDDLLTEVQGIDVDATREAVERHTVAYATEHGGTRVADRAAVRGDDEREDLFDALADLLRAKYDRVERTEAEIVARQTGFDPEKARDCGVPEGPKFGRLAGGEPVEVDGRRIAPEDVESERTARFSL